MKSFFSIVLLVFCGYLTIPSILAQNADCNKLLGLTDTIFNAKNISGFGDKQEFKNNFNDNLTTFPLETNSIWYLIKIPSTGAFTFDILSDNKDDDWDFLLYENKNLFCKRIDSNKIKPIRANLSRSANTGLSLAETEQFSSPGINNNYSKFIDVKQGQSYVLVVNNPKRTYGNHQLILHYPTLPPIKRLEVLPVIVEKEKPKLNFTFDVKDLATNLPVSSNVSLSGLLKETIDLQDITNYQVILERSNYRVILTLSAPGYMLYSTKILINKTKSTFHQTILLERIEEGKKVSLAEIQFQAGNDKFLNTSKSSLNALLIFMQQNTQVKIEIEGHVNGPGQPNHEEFKQLSIDRATAVKNYLLENGMDESRISISGYGNSKMIYPDPKTDDEHSANRRVEIKVVSR